MTRMPWLVACWREYIVGGLMNRMLWLEAWWRECFDWWPDEENALNDDLMNRMLCLMTWWRDCFSALVAGLMKKRMLCCFGCGVQGCTYCDGLCGGLNVLMNSRWREAGDSNVSPLSRISGLSVWSHFAISPLILLPSLRSFCLILFCFWPILLTSFSLNLHFSKGRLFCFESGQEIVL